MTQYFKPATTDETFTAATHSARILKDHPYGVIAVDCQSLMPTGRGGLFNPGSCRGVFGVVVDSPEEGAFEIYGEIIPAYYKE